MKLIRANETEGLNQLYEEGFRGRGLGEQTRMPRSEEQYHPKREGPPKWEGPPFREGVNNQNVFSLEETPYGEQGLLNPSCQSLQQSPFRMA